ncbi:DUF1642 domain-containing protein [Enterococcus sp. BWR-S5]|uniref:DUF1642 domain-containing protein n=1 Tax=Enterococcus sp. BWR-S5 TaxID=2787714 RepID=UPI0019240B2C|nr:DUF1642 domain-containing protein [Enterococcus sp. BWR-S5]MBL1225391.1 DUF1642 domain-containing protein [Enterococcus sp. BWR-S5]
MSMVEEKIKKILDVKKDVNSGPWKDAYKTGFAEASYQAINHLEEIQAEQEELQKKADAYEQLRKLSNQGTPTSRAAEDMKKFGKAFGNAMDRNKRMNAVARLLEEFLESDWDFYDESETEQGAMEYAQKIIELFDEQNKPVVLPKWIVEEYFEDNPSGWVSTVVSRVMNDGRINEDSKIIANSARELEKILCVAFVTGNYTVQQEQLYYVELPLDKTVNGFGRLAIDCKSGQQQIVHTKVCLMPNQKTIFTESEIKAIDERYWPFAVKVEEDQR